MNEHRLEVADIFRQHGEEFLNQWGHTVSPQQRKALRDIAICRTATLGGHVKQCDACGHRIIAYNSCRNRHCPKCQSAARDRWLAERAKELLPVPYCHVVFTVPGAAALHTSALHTSPQVTDLLEVRFPGPHCPLAVAKSLGLYRERPGRDISE